MGADDRSMEVGIAIGSNLGDRMEHLRSAVAALRPHLSRGATIEKSAVFATAPVDCPAGSAAFYNAVIVVRYDGTGSEMLTLTREIERNAGRPSAESRVVNAPRVLDLDLLYAGDERVETEQLVLPHPRLHQRRFVLEPLVSLRPDLVLPGEVLTLLCLLDELQSDEPPLEWVAAEW
ncbi:MAG: 2-amino-4-hydroxy-6-hydroxymethyldihydropteridine diphosphokinase [Verrucomicrobiales bacterium]|jgi:2-amino-4-hydroxy-6-hydroxymethyldihydropteridine diphosphokinase